MKEKEWKVIQEAPNYEVSNYGDVRNIKTKKILKPGKLKAGYLKVVLCVDGKKLQRYCHRLAAIAFLPNEENFPQVNHKDEVKANNYVGSKENDYKDGNLEWCSAKYNINYNDLPKKKSQKIRQKIENCELEGAIIVYAYDAITNEFCGKFGSMREAARQFNCDISTISKVANPNRPDYKTCKGMKFFKEPQDFDKN